MKLQGSLEGCNRSSSQDPQAEPAQGFRLSVLPPSSDSHCYLLQFSLSQGLVLEVLSYSVLLEVRTNKSTLSMWVT